MNRREFFKGSAWVLALAALAPTIEKGNVARHHLAATMKGDEVVFYFDGEVVPETALRGERPVQWVYGGAVWDCALGRSDMRWLAAGIDPKLVCPAHMVTETPFSLPFYPFALATDFYVDIVSEVTFSLFVSDKFPDSLNECFPQYRRVDWVNRADDGYWMRKCRIWLSDGLGLNDKIDAAVIGGTNLCEDCGGICLLKRRA